MMAAKDGAGEKRRSPWCLAIARYVAAGVVTAFLFMFIVRAVDVVLRPAKLNISVEHGTVSADLSWKPKPKLTFHFNLIVTNPSGRAGIYVNNNTVRLLRQSGGSSLQLLNARLSPIYLSPGSYSEIAVTYHKKNVSTVPKDDLRALGKGSSFTASVQVNAPLGYRIGPRDEAGGRDIRYYCWPVVVAAVKGSSQDNTRNVQCTTDKD